jgi:hypothetical protein
VCRRAKTARTYHIRQKPAALARKSFFFLAPVTAETNRLIGKYAELIFSLILGNQ